MMKGKIFVNGKIYSMNNDHEVFNKMIIQGDSILELLKAEEDIVGFEDYEKIDLKGNAVFPGFIDSHVHLTQTGLSYIGVQFKNVTNVKTFLDSVDYYGLRLSNESIVFGMGYDELVMDQNTLPTMEELNNVMPDRYLWLSRVDSHSCLVNSLFLKHLNFAPDVKGVDLNEENLPTGVLRDEANSIARKVALDMVCDNVKERGLKIALKKAVEKGITCLHALEGGPLFSDSDYQFISTIADRSPIRIESYYQKMDIEFALSRQMDRLGGCIILDGSFGSRTAALYEPYSDADYTNGTLYIDEKELGAFVIEASSKGIQLAFHALGERAIGQVLDAYSKAFERYPDIELRHRIEHFELPTQKHIEQASQMGILISVQPAFDYYWGGDNSMYVKRLGAKRAKRTNPFRSMVEKGCILIGGSDSDVTEMNPIIGIHGAVNHSNADESISVYDAIRMFTYNGAYAINSEHEYGTLELGKKADFIILDQDLLTIDCNKIDAVQVLETHCNGVCVFSRN